MQWCGRVGNLPTARTIVSRETGGCAVPTWVEFNWGSRGAAYRVGDVIVAHYTWADTLQVNVYGHDESNNMLLNVFHVHTADVPTQADCDAVAASVADWMNGVYNNTFALNISTDRVVVTDVSAIDSWQAEVPVSAAGTLAGVAVPSNVTLAVKKSTGRAGRANRGDWYSWPCTTAQLETLDSNLFLMSHRDAVVSALNQLRTQLTDAGYPMVVASKASGLTRELLTFVATDRAVDSQRRRLRGRGR
jgi:hypothetical protein